MIPLAFSCRETGLENAAEGRFWKIAGGLLIYLAMTAPQIDGHVEVPGHEKTITTLEKIIAAYRTASFDLSGKYNFDQKRQNAAVSEILALSQFYTRYDAIQMLGRVINSPRRPAPASPPRSKPKSP